MFKINRDKLSDFDTQVMTLINLAPDHWALGVVPTLVCHHKDFGWFHRHWIFGVQPMLNLEDGGYSRVRRLTWRGQILLRLKVRELKHSAVKLDVAEVHAPHPNGGNTIGALKANPAHTHAMSGGSGGGGSAGPLFAQRMQAQQARLSQQMQQMAQQAMEPTAIRALQQGVLAASSQDEMDAFHYALTRGRAVRPVAMYTDLAVPDPGSLAGPEAGR